MRDMEVSSLIGNKHRKHHEEGINGLHDDILHEIMSYLQIKEAIRTSLLSKQWNGKWMGVSKMRLVEEGFENRQQFTNFVKRLVAVFNPKFLRKFFLACEVGEDTVQVINQLLSGFINSNIEELRLDFERVEEPLVFPDDLFTSKTLTHFHLSMPQVIMLPPFIYFYSLMTLTLKYVIFPDASSTQQLFTSCPFLEELTLIDCIWKNVSASCIVCPSLRTLIIREWKDDNDNHNEEEENDALDENVPTCCRIVIIGNNMKTLSYDGDILNDYFLYSTASITDGVVEVQPPPPNNNTLDAGHFALRLLKALSNVEKLSISDLTVEALCNTTYLIPHLPFFNNMAELHVESLTLVSLECEALLTIIRRSPILKVVEFAMGVSLDKNAVKKVDPLPACMGRAMKTIRIYRFSGDEEEVFAMKFLLQSRPVLDGFRLYSNAYCFDSVAGSKRLNKLYRQIVQFPRASPDCQLYFEAS